MSGTRIRKLSLSKFRSYRAAALTVDAQLAVLVGPNGAGKTNLIEALSFLAPGRGLRRARLDEVTRRPKAMSWAVASTLDTPVGRLAIGTGLEPPHDKNKEPQQVVRIDGRPAASQ